MVDAIMANAFPAHAGMNRCNKVYAYDLLRVPRACGDEPPAPAVIKFYEVRSPRMRG